MKKFLCILTIAALMLAMLTACTSKNIGQPASIQQSSPAASDKEALPEKKPAAQPESQSPSAPAETSPAGLSNERITFMTQEYKGDNIAEIPYIEYDGETNPEIESINRAMNQGLQRIYDDFMEDPENYWIEIRSYPFTSPDYLQVVTTCCIFPNQGHNGDLSSINYDRKAKRWISNQEILDQLGMTEDDLSYKINKLFEPELPEEKIDTVKLGGFLIREGPEGHFVELLIEIMSTSPETSRPIHNFYSYTPDLGQLLPMNLMCLFDPAEMDQMDPPLSYQMIPEMP
ncbi:MAG: hypothetical protein GXY60_11860 [Spirochaetales bacterium]|nr:hypothetical protein [Spirochaetales bacterium]